MPAFPAIKLISDVAPTEMASAVDFVNRVNWFFDIRDLAAMKDAFLPHAVVYLPQGTLRGHAEMDHFFLHKYPYLIPGVSRLATNHIVDADEDGVVVVYHNLVMRYAPPEEALAPGAGQIIASDDGLPAIWLYSPIRDRLRRTATGWKIWERYIGGSATNNKLTPPISPPAARIVV